MSDVSQSVPLERTYEKTQAQKWGEIAVAFIASASATGIFALLGYALWPVVTGVAIACSALAALCFVVFAVKSITIIRWWIVLAKRERAS